MSSTPMSCCVSSWMVAWMWLWDVLTDAQRL